MSIVTENRAIDPAKKRYKVIERILISLNNTKQCSIVVGGVWYKLYSQNVDGDNILTGIWIPLEVHGQDFLHLREEVLELPDDSFGRAIMRHEGNIFFRVVCEVESAIDSNRRTAMLDIDPDKVSLIETECT